MPYEIRPSDLIINTYRTSHQGGWSLKTDTGVQIYHKPSGIIVKCDDDRSAHKNRANALEELELQLAILTTAPGFAGFASDRTPPMPPVQPPRADSVLTPDDFLKLYRQVEQEADHWIITTGRDYKIRFATRLVDLADGYRKLP